MARTIKNKEDHHRMMTQYNEILKKIAEYKAKDVDMILCTGGMSVDPVSYTHLDVYKRQVRRVADAGKVKHLRCGAEGKPSLKRAHIVLSLIHICSKKK